MTFCRDLSVEQRCCQRSRAQLGIYAERGGGRGYREAANESASQHYVCADFPLEEVRPKTTISLRFPDRPLVLSPLVWRRCGGEGSAAQAMSAKGICCAKRRGSFPVRPCSLRDASRS